jgi:hypothetical protein
MTSIFYRLRMALPVMGLFFLALGAAPVSHAAELIYDKGGASLFYADDSCSTFSVTGAGTASVTVTCGTGGGPDPITPSGCQLSAVGSTSLSSDGGAVTFNVTGCQGVTAGTTTYQLQRNSVSVGSASTSASGLTHNENRNTTTTAVTSTYRARVCNGSSCANTTNTVNVTVAGAQGGGDDGINKCGSANSITDIAWANGSQLSMDVGATGAVAVRFTVPQNVSSRSLTFNVAEFGGPSILRNVVVSPNACDFDDRSVMDPVFAGIFQAKLPTGSGADALLKAGKTYYLNIRNQKQDGSSSCGKGGCNMLIILRVNP